MEDEAFLGAMAGLDAKLIALALAFPATRHAVALQVLRAGVQRIAVAATWPEEAI